MEKAFEELLPREIVKVEIKEKLSDKLSVMEDIVNYGTNLIPRCLYTSSKDIADIVILSILLKNLVANMDAINVLLGYGSIVSSRILIRALLENVIYIEWILLDNTIKKAKCYYVWHLLQKRKFLRGLLCGTPENNSLKQNTAECFNSLIKLYTPKKIKYEIDKIDNKLELESLSNISNKFTELKQNNRLRNWYSPFNKRGINDLASDTCRKDEYTLLFKYYSGDVHSVNIDMHISLSNSSLKLSPIRTSRNADELLSTTISLVFEVYMKILEKYRPDEAILLAKKYNNEWRETLCRV